MFSLFSVVTFKNAGCVSQTNGRNGTCYTAEECSSKSGKASGNCASGFGVCCLFTVSSTSTTINQNNTYILNPGYPSVYSGSNGLTYTIKKCSDDVCAIRLDFETFSIDGPSSSAEPASAEACVDSFQVSGDSGLKSPVICGLNTGEHVYIDVGTELTATATLSFMFSSTTSSTTRQWDIRASQIECHSSVRPPSGCLQYHTTLTGRVQSFNWDASVRNHLSSQDYAICVRPAQGYCCIEYTQCTSLGFAISKLADAQTYTDTECTEDYLIIDGLVQEGCQRSSGGLITNKICGEIFGAFSTQAIAMLSICDCYAPFNIQVVTDATSDAGTHAANENAGFCFDYMQRPC